MSLRETFILKIVKYEETHQDKVSLTLRNIKSEKSLIFNSTDELARYLEFQDFANHPKYQEQQKIADCLSSIDELIELQTNKIESLKQHKKGLMQGLFPSEE